MRPAARAATLSAFFPLVLACGGSEPPPATPPAPPAASAAASASEAPAASSAPAQTPAPPATQEAAHKLAILAASCWFGGAWGDALGEKEDVKKANADSRCRDLEQKVWGGADDKTHLEQLRAMDAAATGDVIGKVDALAKGDAADGPRRENLVKMTTAMAEALKETMLARRAGDRVKRDLSREPEKLTADEVASVAPLRAHEKLEALYKLDAGDLSKEAHALALLCALDRVEVARGLPKHLKLYAAADSFHLFFGVTIPDVPADATAKLVPGTWLKFLAATAAAAGHAVPDKAKTPREKDALAWSGMLEGFSDKLKAEFAGVSASTDLNSVVSNVLHRLEMEFKAQQAAEETVGAKKTGPAPKK
jgi:hypothetical protein